MPARVRRKRGTGGKKTTPSRTSDVTQIALNRSGKLIELKATQK